MTGAPVTFRNPTGLANVLRSFLNWLKTNVPAAGTGTGAIPITYFFTSQMKPVVFPSVTVDEFQDFEVGDKAWGNEIFPMAGSGKQQQGRLASTRMDINIYTDLQADASAKLKMWQIRDRFVWALHNVGVSDDVTNVVALPPITVYDYDQATPADTLTLAWVPKNEDNHIIHRYYAPTEETPNFHRYQLLVKLCWWELN